MQLRITGSILLGAIACSQAATAQTQPAATATVRTVIAATKLPTVTDTPVYFDVASVTLAPDQKSGVSKANGVLYQLSGSTEVSLAGETKTINAGEGLFIGVGKSAQLKAGGGAPSTFLHFFLVSAADVDKPAETAPAAVKQVYRTSARSRICGPADTTSTSRASRFPPGCHPTPRIIARVRLSTTSCPGPAPTRSTAR
jgi:quercetin dioxygenase-like cupin family protein